MKPPSRPTALALVAALWAAIYLPGLGSTEIKGEEGRRILPAVAMLETGRWLVPYLGGEPYLRKPPLINWAIAASFKLTGVRNEWTARLPSALCVLALGLTIVAIAGPGWLPLETALIAALMAITQFGLLAKAKFAGAEIEGVYAPLTGLAIVTWLAWHAQRRSPWAKWLIPGALLGAACLAKGPSLHLLFFYAIVASILWKEKRRRELLSLPHLAGAALCAAIFAAWAIPYFQSPEAAEAAAVWKRQGLDRFTDSDFNAIHYFTNLPRALGDQLPWILLLFIPGAVFTRGRSAGAAAEPPTSLRSIALATLACFVVVLLIPGTLPRYVLPLGTPIAVVLATALVASSRIHAPLRLTLQLTTAIAVAMILYAWLVVPRLRAHENIRPTATAIDSALPAGATLTVYDPGYLPALFYLRTQHRYAPHTEDIPPDAEWVLARATAAEKLATKRPDLHLAQTLPGKGDRHLLLLRRTVPKK